MSNSLYPKIEKLLNEYPKLELLKADINKLPEIKSALSVYVTPAVLGYIDGQEFLRKARHISLSDIAEAIDRYYEFMTNEMEDF